MVQSKIPQARIAINRECRKRCIYCTPLGEAGSRQNSCSEISPEQIEAVTRALVERGVSTAKLTGGDPVWRPELTEIIWKLKNIPGLKEIEVVTKAPLRHLVRDLYKAGLTGVTISLDSLQRDRVQKITGVDCQKDCLDSIISSRELGLPVTMNMVVMRGINDDEIPKMIEFTSPLGVTLKLLDVIRLPGNEAFWRRHFLPLGEICAELQHISVSMELETHPGGIGHPMRLYYLESGALVLVKDATAGAWYSDICSACKLFPCHDAITALWVTPDGKIKQCLTRDDDYVNLLGLIEEKAPAERLEEAIQRILDTYRNARFIKCPWTHLLPHTAIQPERDIVVGTAVV